MRLSDFDFEVPESLVAQRPVEPRDASRMLVLHRKSGRIEHRMFRDLPSYLTASDFMVFNRSRVVKARLIGQRPSGGKVEVFLLRQLGDGHYECLVKATAAKKIGLAVDFGGGFGGEVVAETGTPMVFEVRLRAASESVDAAIERVGRIPLPPYIRREADGADTSRYQTVFAKDPGSAAAPTAGLHFTEATIDQLRRQGVQLREVLLHVGLGTFQPIKVEDILDHHMHREQFEVSASLARECAGAREKGQRVVAVGTTSVRALESAARGWDGQTDLFLRPGEEFRWVDAIFTNFHQPKSSLSVMMAAFLGGPEPMRAAYAEAVKEKYRFFSYGDCMLVI